MNVMVAETAARYPTGLYCSFGVRSCIVVALAGLVVGGEKAEDPSKIVNRCEDKADRLKVYSNSDIR